MSSPLPNSLNSRESRTEEQEISEKMAPKIKVTYFNLRGRAEPVRLLLAYGGLEYEDCRLVPGFEDPKPWMALKPKTPYGGLPLLEWNGETIAQSLTITRHNTDLRDIREYTNCVG